MYGYTENQHLLTQQMLVSASLHKYSKALYHIWRSRKKACYLLKILY